METDSKPNVSTAGSGVVFFGGTCDVVVIMVVGDGSVANATATRSILADLGLALSNDAPP